MEAVRVRFAPSPTGPLHIGGVRTALYNYLLAQKTGGTFILRIEDTDQKRYVEGAENYIQEALEWLGLLPDESPIAGGPFGPYRQSERKDIYAQEVQRLIDNGTAYYAFDTDDDLAKMREDRMAQGIHSPRYDASIRMEMKNSLCISDEETQKLLDEKTSYVIRMKVPENEEIRFQDIVRGEVVFQSTELDDKVIMKSDGLPTYHLANIIDDHAMKITHVIRGEEWLSSTAHHVLLYKSFGWEEEVPLFAHLPLILKPSGKGKLSKRDGAKFGFPVFPLEWDAGDEIFGGFREFGYLPEAVINFLALLGWNSGTDQEIFSLPELVDLFSLEQISKSGAKFDVEKSKWFNAQYVRQCSTEELYARLKGFDPIFYSNDKVDWLCFIDMFKDRVELLSDFKKEGQYLIVAPTVYDEKALKKRVKADNISTINAVKEVIANVEMFNVEEEVKNYIKENDLSFGAVLPALRIAVTGGLTGPDLFEMMQFLGQQEVVDRIERMIEHIK